MPALTAAQIATLTTAKDSLIAAIATHTAGDPFTLTYSIGNRSKTVNSLEEAIKAVGAIDRLLDNTAPTAATRTSYGRYKRY
jgi:hypothetical protein